MAEVAPSTWEFRFPLAFLIVSIPAYPVSLAYKPRSQRSEQGWDCCNSTSNRVAFMRMAARIAPDGIKVCECNIVVLYPHNPYCKRERNMQSEPETRRIRARQVGMLMQGYRLSHRGRNQGRRLSQEGLLQLMGQVDDKYLDTYDRSTVARWESGEIRPSKDRLEVFAQALGLAPAHLEGMLVLAGLEPTGSAQAESRPAVAEKGRRRQRPHLLIRPGMLWTTGPRKARIWVR